MRYRRAERCVLRAQAALEAGLEEEALAALAEAQTLKSDAPDIDTLRAAIRQRRAAASAGARRRTLRLAAIAAAVVLALGGAIAFWPVPNEPHPPVAMHLPIGPAAANRAPLAAPADKPPSVADPAPAAPRPTAMTTRANAAEPIVSTSGTKPPAPEADSLPPVLHPDVKSRGEGATEKPLPVVAPADEQPLPAPEQTTRTASLAAPPSTIGADGMVKGLPSTPTARPPTPPAPPPAPAAPAPVVSEDTRIRAVLSQFEAAYSALSASAARAVWPSVDERSLARAFDSLDSQQVSLGRCEITVNGQRADVSCAGTTSWTPKVGGGRRTAPRSWRFQLATVDGAWQIRSAEAR